MSDEQQHQARSLQQQWDQDPRWQGITRPYTADDVVRLRGSKHIDYTLARDGADKLWQLLRTEPFVNALGALTGNQAMQQVKAGLKAIYLSGWQVAGDANLAGEMYPDQSLYPANSVPSVVKSINNTLQRADQIQHMEGSGDTDWFAPIVADAEAGFGGVLNAFELMKAMIEAGASGVHFEDQLASAKKCGHMGGKVLVPTQEAVQKLVAARLAADVLDVPTVVLARTDAEAANLPSAPANARPRATTGCATDWTRPSPGAWPTRRTSTCCGVKRAGRIWISPGSSPTPSTSTIPTNCWPITVRPRSTGSSWTGPPSPASSANWAQWATSSNSSPWPASTP
jgi:isocitrate lyase